MGTLCVPGGHRKGPSLCKTSHEATASQERAQVKVTAQADGNSGTSSCCEQCFGPSASRRHLLEAGQRVAPRVSGLSFQFGGLVHTCWTWLGTSLVCMQQTQVVGTGLQQQAVLHSHARPCLPAGTWLSTTGPARCASTILLSAATHVDERLLAKCEGDIQVGNAFGSPWWGAGPR